MRAISLFSGAGGFEQGFDRAGIDTILQAECDPHCLAILERHWPHVRRTDDVRKVTSRSVAGGRGDLERGGGRADAERLRHQRGADHGVDLVYGGFPCQDVSVAGQRRGLSGDRSGLWSEFRRILSELRPRWLVVENVPGLLSSNGGRDFLRILMDLDELGYGVAWRVLDARWFGVPQRRRRVFVVGCLGDAARAQAVLAVCESCGGDPAEGGEAGEGTAYALAASVRGTGDGHGNAWNSNYVASTLSSGSHPGSNLPGRRREDDTNLVAHTLPAEHRGIGNGWNHNYIAGPLAPNTGPRGHDAGNFQSNQAVDAGHIVVGSQIDDGQARPLTARGTGYRMDMESENFVVADPISASEGRTYTHEGAHNFRLHNVVAFGISSDALDRSGEGESGSAADRAGLGIVEDASPALRARHPNAVAFKPSHYTRDKDGAPSETYPPLSADADKGDQDPLVAVWQTQGSNVGTSGTLKGEGTNGANGVPFTTGSAGVRRLTPLECERLMGWPDEWTKGLPDSHRYRMCGNGVVAPVAEWIGHRLVVVDKEREPSRGSYQLPGPALRAQEEL